MKSHPSPIQRILRLNHRWEPSLRLSRRGVPPSNQAVTWAHQGSGIPGWLVLTRDPEPIALFVDRDSKIEKHSLVIDERCFEDSIFRVEKTPTHLYLADLWMFNGTPIFDKTTFEERREKMKELFHTFFTNCPAFQTICVDLRSNMKDYRGKEYYTNDRGARGIFVESDLNKDEMRLEVIRTDIPDVYRIPSNNEYLRVRTLELSSKLKTMGDKFFVRCKNNNDGTWDPLLSSNTVTNEEKSSPQ